MKRNAVPGDILPRSPEEEAEYALILRHKVWLEDGAEEHVQLALAMSRASASSSDYQVAILREAIRRLKGEARDQYGILDFPQLNRYQLDGIWNAGFFLARPHSERDGPLKHIPLRLWRTDHQPFDEGIR